MRAFVVSGPGRCSVDEVEPPRVDRGQVVVDVERAGVCGTDVEFFTGEMAYLHQGHASYPMRLGHEWCGRVASVGLDVDVDVDRCSLYGRHHARVWTLSAVPEWAAPLVWAHRFELGIRGGWPGALAEQMAVPVIGVARTPGGRRCHRGSHGRTRRGAPIPRRRRLRSGKPVSACPLSVPERSVCSPRCSLSGVARGARARRRRRNARVRSHARRGRSVDGIGIFPTLRSMRSSTPPTRRRSRPACSIWSNPLAVRSRRAGRDAEQHRHVDACSQRRDRGRHPGRLRRPGRRHCRVRVGGRVDPRPLVAATVSLDEIGGVLAGTSPPRAGHGPKIHVDPRL